MPVTIYEDFANRPNRFWLQMGPFFASRAMHQELPRLFDAPGCVWFVMSELVEDANTVVAFASIDIDTKKSVGHLRNLYVIPSKRGGGYASELMRSRLEYLRGARIAKASTSRRVSKEVHFSENYGFRPVRVESGWQILELNLIDPIDPTGGAAPATDLSSDPAYKAGFDAAVVAIAAREGKRLNFRKVKPLKKDFGTWTDQWETFIAGWAAAVAAHYQQVTTWGKPHSTNAEHFRREAATA